MLRASLLPPILQLSHSSNTVPKIKSLRSINPYPQIQPFESCGRALKGLLAYVIPIFSLSSALRRPITLFTIRMAIISWQQSEPAGFSIRSSSYNTLHAHTHTGVYTATIRTPTHVTWIHTRSLYIHGPAHACSFIDFAGVKGESGRQWIQRPMGWYIETGGQKRALLVEAGRETEDFCLRSLITVLTYADENARMIGRVGREGKENYWKIDFYHSVSLLISGRSIDAWPHLCVCSPRIRAIGLSSKGEIR